jgi:hypothetical protein
MQSYRQLADDFKRLAKNNTLSHSYLFFGGDDKNHQEKFLFSQSLANFLENGTFDEPLRLLQETLIISPDEKGTIGIDSIRDLKYFLWQKPTNSSRRVAIIKEAENLTPEAQNAALKIVEEPPESTLIIFISNIEDNLFPALTSRLQKVYFPGSVASDANGQVKAEKYAGPRESIEKIIEDDQINQFFESLINDLRKDPVKNSKQLKETLSRLALMKQFNINKKLQLKALISSISK